MKKTALMAAITAAVIMFGGAVYAQMAGGNGGRGMGYGYGPGWCLTGTSGSTNIDNLKKFQKETLSLRDELATKRAELGNEYSKTTPDSARVSALEEDIAGIQAKIQQSADKYGVATWGRGGGRGFRGRGMMYASGPYGCPRR